MPTGYTAEIKDGISFETYALKCARAFGACIMQRDDNSNSGAKLQEPSDYHYKQVAEADLRLSKATSMSIKDCSLKSKSEFQETKEKNQNYKMH